MRSTTEHIALSIAGFDPCAGAGVLSDIQTFMRHHIKGMAVNTCITSQDEDKVFGIEWLTVDQIIFQLKPILDRYSIEFIKIGLIESLESLSEIISYIKTNTTEAVKIVWDPIIKTSSGFQVLNRNPKLLHQILQDIYLVTPNIPEHEWLSEQLENISSCHLLIKGGHSSEDNTTDRLTTLEGAIFEISGKRIKHQDKHGTGCVLSASILSYLSKGYSLKEACTLAKNYIESYLVSSESRLGNHFHIDI